MTADQTGGEEAAPIEREVAHPAVRRAVAALDDAGLRWLLLRGSLAGAEGDVDLLVDPSAGGSLARVLARVDFHGVPAIGHAGHRFFRAYHEATDAWLTLDIVSAVAFGRGGWLELPDAADGILNRRVREAASTGASAGDTPVRPDPDDAFWLLALHDLVDRHDRLPSHGTVLRRLARAARTDGPLGVQIDGLLGTGTARRIFAAATTDDETLIAAVRSSIRRRGLRVMPRGALTRLLRHGLAARLRKPYTAVRRRGIDVAVLGPDGAGKSTVAAAMARGLPIATRTVYLGVYGAGLGGARRFALPRRIARLWRGWLVGLWHRLRGRLVVYDRHALDAWISPPRRSPKARIRRWVLIHAIPRPAITFVLDVPGEVLFQRKGEHDRELLERHRDGYRRLAEQVRGVELVDADRDPDAVRRDLVARIWQRWTREAADG